LFLCARGSIQIIVDPSHTCAHGSKSSERRLGTLPL
jgi:hypothetical protein